MEVNQHRTWAEIDLGAIEHNYRVICEPRRRRCCVSSRRTATATALCRSLTACKAWARRISRSRPLPEAVELRENGIEKPILILGYVDAADMDTARYSTASPRRSTTSETAELVARRLSARAAIIVHYKLDTGMTRIGFPSWEREETVRRILECAKAAGSQERGHLSRTSRWRMCRPARNTPRCSMTASAAYARVWRERP